MAAFVTEILTSSGKLEKDDLNAKITQLSKHVNDVKNEVQETLDSRYISFFPCLKETTELSNKVSSVSNEMQMLTNQIENQMTVQLKTSTQEIQELSQQLSDVVYTLKIVEKLLTIYNLLESSTASLNNKEYLLAAKNLEETKTILNDCTYVGEDQIRMFEILKTEYIVRREKLTYDLGEIWNEYIKWTISDLSVELIINTPSLEKPQEIVSFLKAMHLMNYLDQKLKTFAKNFFDQMCAPVMCRQVEVEEFSKLSCSSLQLKKCRSLSRPLPSFVFHNIAKIFNFLASSVLNTVINDDDDDVEGPITLMTKLGHLISKDFCDLLIKECLSTAIPGNKSDLTKYHEVIKLTESLQTVLSGCGFLTPEQDKILIYARNVDVHFTNKMCQDILEKARALMLEDLHDYEHLSTKAETDEITFAMDSLFEEKLSFKSEQLSFASADNLSNNIFNFPPCAISLSVQKLLRLMYAILNDAITSSPLCAVRLFYTSRNIVELYCDVVPVYHKDRLTQLPQLAALFHNNCMLVAHHLLTLGHQFYQKLPAVIRDQFITYVDLIPSLRSIGSDVFTNQMLCQKKLILEPIHELGGFHNMTNDKEFISSLDRALRQSLHQLFFLKRLWENILPLQVYYQVLGTLLNSLLEEIMYQIISQDDIASECTQQLVSIFENVTTKSQLLFQVENEDSSSVSDVHQFVVKWMKFKELLLVLGGSMKDILDRWAEGKGPLAHEFTVNEIKQLIRALFQNTERRAAALARIK